MAERFIRLILFALPLAFAIGFLAPVIAAGMLALGVTAPWNMTSMNFALLVAGAWGLFATVSGRWI